MKRESPEKERTDLDLTSAMTEYAQSETKRHYVEARTISATTKETLSVIAGKTGTADTVIQVTAARATVDPTIVTMTAVTPALGTTAVIPAAMTTGAIATAAVVNTATMNAAVSATPEIENEATVVKPPFSRTYALLTVTIPRRRRPNKTSTSGQRRHAQKVQQ
jgi:cell division protein FtsI/penicillin-binding protein 2